MLQTRRPASHEENHLDPKHRFTGYALTLLTAVGSLLTATVLAGISSLPSPLTFLEHVALGLSIRFSYKWVGGFDWADWSFGSDATGEGLAAAGYARTRADRSLRSADLAAK